MRLNFQKKVSVKISSFSSAAEFFLQTSRKVLPRVGITNTFADRQAQHARFCYSDDILQGMLIIDRLTHCHLYG
jgi:hypothetical protein